MIKICHVLHSLILCMGCFTAHAQDGRIPAPVSVIIASYKSIQQLPQPDWLIKEGDSPLTIQDLLSGDIKDGQVLAIDPNEIIIEQFEKYWFAIEFISEVDLHNWLLHVENSYTGYGYSNNFSEIRSYGLLDGQLAATGITGFFVPASKRDFNSRHTQSLLNLNLKSGSSLTLWMNISKNYTLTTTFPVLSIYDPSITLPSFPLEKRNHFLFGSFLVIWILALIMFLYLKDKTSIWFLIFTTLLAVDNLTIWSSDPLTPLLYPENPQNGLYFGAWTSFLLISILIQFSRVFIDLRFKHKKLDKIILGAVWVLLFSSFILFHLTLHFENISFFMLYMLIFIGIYLVSVAAYLFLNDPLSRFMGIGLLLLITPQVIQMPFDILYLAYSGLMVTVLLGVGYRIKMLFKDRMQADKEKKDLLMHQNTLLEKQVADRTAELSHSLNNLRSTQAQLIQSEKMASLGELTAGIAHEIQNPLNFVNNFSDVSEELVIELREEMNRGDLEEAKVISNDVIQNLQKIKHHGQRASDIVKGMLAHSRSSNGQKEPTDINALADEYLRLSYHGLRAKDKSFNADFKTNFDPYFPKINVIPQDIGRVLLNLINNAFYAVQVGTQHAASLKQTPQKQTDYKPLVMVSTKNMGTRVEICVKDNGPGIPAEIKDKIFQPFFTTKPTGQGTGLGLSLSYDIVKAHGGELKVETLEGEGSKFIIQLPI